MFIMKLPHKALRLFISASVVVLTSSFLIYELIASHKSMNGYMRYIIEKADSSFLYDKYQNQSIAAHLMRTLATPRKRSRRIPAIPFASRLKVLTQCMV